MISIQQYLEDTSKADLFNFVEYFCNKNTLPMRQANLDTYLRSIVDKGTIDLNNCRVFYKNHYYRTKQNYDGMTITRLDGFLLYWVSPCSLHDENKAVAYKLNEDPTSPVVKGGWFDVLEYFEGVDVK